MSDEMETVVAVRDVLNMLGDLCSDCQTKVRIAMARGIGASKNREVLNGIVLQVCEETNTSLQEIKYGGRHQGLVEVRVKIAKMAREAGFSLPEIGRAMNKHHTSVLHLLNRKV